jgi:hypothetical protein
VLICLSVGIVALYSSWRRPIWTDEATHFVWGANPVSLTTVLKIIESTHQLQHGQTGIYLLLNQVSLNWFGASALVLRAPSLLAAVLLCLAAAYFMRVRQFSFAWQVLAVLAMGALSYVMYFAGEARPYMVLAASVAGVLVYYAGTNATGYPEPSVALQFVGFTSILCGILNHAYFGLYWICLATLAYLWQESQQGSKLSAKSLWRFTGPRLILLGLVTWGALGLATWMRPNPRGAVDPFEFQARENLVKIFVDAHFNFVWPFPFVAITFLATMATVVALLVIRQTRNPIIAPLWMPISLVGLAGALTFVLSLASYFSSYWILSRQWIASMALIPIAFVWFFAILSRQISQIGKPVLPVVVFLVAAIPVALAFGERVNTQIKRLEEYAVAYNNIDVPTGTLTEEIKRQLWTELGWGATNVNIKVGGPVWEVFRQ